MKHSTEEPRRPSEIVSSIPQPLEDVVLHAMAKDPQNRPANADAFRQELYETAERLGLEHAGAASAPSMEALRSAGTESPSGRLVIDLGRLRENRATTSGARNRQSSTAGGGLIEAEYYSNRSGQPANAGRPDHSRVHINVNYRGSFANKAAVRDCDGPDLLLAGWRF
jgi:hypothetical protein